jgi:rSAM/selenodomain-associated transferase 1
MQRVLGLFARLPQAGRVKTRLAASIGPVACAELYTAFVADAIETVRGLDCRRVIAHTPADAIATAWFDARAQGDFELWPQPEGSLGDRMAGFLHTFAEGDSRLLILGTDSPSLPVEQLSDAFDRLEDCDVVLGPALDGGFYLLGANARARDPSRRATDPGATSEPGRKDWRDLFDGIDWGGSTVLSRTIQRIEADGRSLALLPAWYDVDDDADLEMLQQHLAAMTAAGRACPCPATASWLSDWRDA